MPEFSELERRIIDIFNGSREFKYNGSQYKIIVVDKPTVSRGEPKTDIYVKGLSTDKKELEIKISVKKENADFLENKITADRLQQIFGRDWNKVLVNSITEIKSKFLTRPLIYKSGFGRVQKGCITLGWKFEFLNVQSGQLSGQIITEDNSPMVEVYTGRNLPSEKKNALVKGRPVINAGVADFILFSSIDDINSVNDIINKLVTVEEYILKEDPKLYFACKALNYRTLASPPKWDGDRPLAVYIDWKCVKNVLVHNYVFDEPLMKRGNAIGNNLKAALEQLNVNNTNLISSSNVQDNKIIHN